MFYFIAHVQECRFSNVLYRCSQVCCFSAEEIWTSVVILTSLTAILNNHFKKAQKGFGAYFTFNQIKNRRLIVLLLKYYNFASKTLKKIYFFFFMSFIQYSTDSLGGLVL